MHIFKMPNAHETLGSYLAWHIRATKQKNERKSEKFINVKVHRESKPLHRLFFDVSDTV